MNALRRAAAAAVALLPLASPAGAQRWLVGGKSGVSHVQVRSSEFAWSGMNSASGAFFQGYITDRISITNELLVTQRRGVSALTSSTLTLIADYVELPLMAQYRVGTWSGITPFVTAGPSLTLRTRCRLQFVGGGFASDDDCDVGRYRTHGVDYGANAGAGLSWTSGIFTVSAEARYAQGLRQNVLPTGVVSDRAYGWSAFASLAVPLYRSRTAPPMPLPVPPMMARETTRAYVPPATERSVVRVPADDPLTRLVSLDATDLDIREFFDRVAQASGVPIIVAPQVRGRVSTTLSNVTVLDALTSVVDRASLAMTRSVESGQWVVHVDLLPPFGR